LDKLPSRAEPGVFKFAIRRIGQPPGGRPKKRQRKKGVPPLNLTLNNFFLFFLSQARQWL